MSPVATFETDEQFWMDWYRQWFLYGTVYAINMPRPRIVPPEEFLVMTTAAKAELDARLQAAEDRVQTLEAEVKRLIYVYMPVGGGGLSQEQIDVGDFA